MNDPYRLAGLADVVAELLADEGYEVAVAINGRLGLESLAQRQQKCHKHNASNCMENNIALKSAC